MRLSKNVGEAGLVLSLLFGMMLVGDDDYDDDDNGGGYGGIIFEVRGGLGIKRVKIEDRDV